MLRRKILARVGILAFAFLLGAVVAVWLLQDVLAQLDRANRDAATLIDGVQTVGVSISRLEAPRDASDTSTPASDLSGALARIAEHPSTAAPSGPAAADYQHLAALLPAFLADAQRADRVSPPADAPAVRAAVQQLGRSLREYVAAEQSQTFRHFRTMVLVLTLAALVMLNAAIVVLLNLSQMILRPVASLVAGARELASENFAHRVTVQDADEFGELARSYNSLAGQLQANEERKTETLHHLAVTLNHALNNAMSIIELQLGMLDRQAGGNPTLLKHLREIRGCLGRMADTVSSLKHIRRVVLTDYAPGLKMLDLERSVSEVEPAPHEPGAPVA